MPAGILDSLTVTPVLAYSTRLLRSAYAGSALRVRRSSDGTEQDVGFLGNGELNVYSLGSFVGAENLVLNSEDLSAGTWTPHGCAVTANATTAPDGTLTADKVYGTGGTTSHYLTGSVTLTGNGGESVYAKAGEWNVLTLSNGPNNWVHFHLTGAGAVSTNGSGWTGSSIEALDNGWYRCFVSTTTQTTSWGATYIFVSNVWPIDGNTVPNSTASSTTNGLYIWGAQVHASTSKLDYAKTVGSTQANGTGSVKTFYDQSGNAHDLSHVDTSQLPLIMSAGLIERFNGKPSPLTNGTDQILETGFLSDIAQPYSRISTIQPQALPANVGFYAGMTSSDNQLWTPALDEIGMYAGSTVSVKTGITPGDSITLTEQYNGTSSTSYYNGVPGTVGDTGTGVFDGLVVGGLTGPSFCANSRYGDITVFSSILPDSDRVTLESDMATYWGTSYSASAPLFSKAGSFTLNAASGNQSITGLGFQPKAIILWVDSVASVSSANELRKSFGVATSSTQRWAMGAAFKQNSGNTDNIFVTNRCLYCNDSLADAAQFSTDLVSFDADGFTLDVLTGSAVTVNYLALGGTDLEALAGNTLTSTTSGNQAITGAGFQPKALLCGLSQGSGTVAGQLRFGLGFTTGTSAQYATNIIVNDVNTNSSTIQESDCLVTGYNNSSNQDTKGTLVSFDADGFTLDWVLDPPNQQSLGYLALGGSLSFAAVSSTQRTTLGTTAVTTTGVDPAAVFLLSGGQTNEALDPSAQQSLGAATGTTQAVSSGFLATSGATDTTLPAVSTSATKALVFASATSGTTSAEAGLSAFGSESFTLDWTKVNASARNLYALAIGSASTVTGRTGTVDVTLADATVALAGSVSVSASLDVVLGDATVSASGTVGSAGSRTATITVNLADATLAATSSVSVSASMAVTLADATLAAHAAGGASVISVVLDDATMTASASAKVGATLSQQLDDATGVASASSTVSASLNVTLDDVTVSASGSYAVHGNINVTLDDVVSLFEAFSHVAVDSDVRCLLVEVGVNVNDVEQTRYLSSHNYVTQAGDTPASIAYLPVVQGGANVNEKLELDGTNGLTFGDIEINNANGEFDSWLNDLWVNREVKIYLGDVRQPRSTFNKVFDGVVEDIDSRSRDLLNLKIRDKLQRLNTAVTEQTLGGDTANKDMLIPLTFGECHNIEPLLVDPALLTYQIHDGPIERIIEVRDNGVPVVITPDLNNGKFTLASPPVGQVTVSAQGDKNPVYVNTVSRLVKILAMRYGKETERFDISEIDQTNLDVFEALCPQPVGYFMKDRVNVLEAIQQIANSVGAQVLVSRRGLLQIKRISLPVPTPSFVITVTDMVENTLTPMDRSAVVAAMKIGYCKNWTVQQNLTSGVKEEHKVLFGQEWLTVTESYSSVASRYKLSTQPTQRDTMLLKGTDATAEAWRLLDMFSVPRMTYQFTGYARMQQLRLGDAVTLVHPRYGLVSGKDGMVVGLAPDWLNGTVTVAVMV